MRTTGNPMAHIAIMMIVLLPISLEPLWPATYSAPFGEPACVTDQAALDPSYDGATSPYLSIEPGAAAAQTFVPSHTVLCTVSFIISDFDGRFIGNLTLRDGLDGRALAWLAVDSYYSGMQDDLEDVFADLFPGRKYVAEIELAPESAPLRWFWASTVSYPLGDAWIRDGPLWRQLPDQDLSFVTFGFDDVSSYSLPDRSWTPEQWRSHNWKTYPVVATGLDVNLDGRRDVYSFNNSYLDGTPVLTNGSVDVGALNRSRMLPVNLSIAFEFTSFLNTSDGRSTLNIFVDRIPDYPAGEDFASAAWILLDSAEFLPLLFSPSGTGLDALNLTWESTLAKNSFRVFFKDTHGRPDGEVWIYIGHFSVQTVTIRGPQHSASLPGEIPNDLFAVVVLVFSVSVALVLWFVARYWKRSFWGNRRT